MALRLKHARFVSEYLKDMNATQAAKRAGYSPKTAKVQGSRLLSYADVKAEITRRQAARAERLEISQTSVLGELARIGFANLADFIKVDTGGTPIVDLGKVSREQMAGLTGLSVRIGGKRGRTANSVKLELDKMGALRALGDHLGLFEKAPIIPAVDPMDEQKRHATVQTVLDILDAMAHGRLVKPVQTIEHVPAKANGGNGQAR